jgi:cation-transporting ATPase 13A1
LDGKCVTNESLLTGEATPQIKEDILDLENDVILNMKHHKRHIIFGGTRVLLHESSNSFKPPDKGCVGIVLRTGFGTSQGKLIRTILFATDRVSANNAEALLFILFLLIFAVIASAYVLIEGLKDEKRSKYKLLLNCVMIITSGIINMNN